MQLSWLTSSHISLTFHPVDLTWSHRASRNRRQLNSAVICLILFGRDGLMDWWACLFSLSSYGMSLGRGQVGWSLWLADTLLSDWRPGRRVQLWSSPFQTSAVECHLLVSKGVTECEGVRMLGPSRAKLTLRDISKGAPTTRVLFGAGSIYPVVLWRVLVFFQVSFRRGGNRVASR
jgi:hypothetical protein